MIWLLGVIGIPILVVALLFFSAAEDFMQIIRLQIDFSRLFGDLVHVLVILALGTLAEMFFLYQFVTYVL
ncbi:hypothetical protein HF669_11665 [Acidithiobacillus thiooxidans]|uniref:hypothetical protein n=1 Tax=Acidithiobacillus TaxID=119977 RepID=UPI0002624B1D|nr:MULTISPECIES: hypothetical protein [Acidithiobacillus]MBU2740249.1 hypothetical protein [Acidithiobacillus albertensis]MBU2812002.1 hypothetical protein [Acidithiobacillus thiooxidans]MBU2834287.1 hypothetical protein [Acidithiobacillus thiooxidans]